MNWFLVDHENNIMGLVLWDPQEGTWQPAPGYRLVPAGNMPWHPGWKWDEEKQCSYGPDPHPLPPPEPDPPQVTPNVIT